MKAINLTSQIKNDSVYIDFEVYDATLIFSTKEDELNGFWRRNSYGKISLMPFRAQKQIKKTQIKKASFDVSGKWAMRFNGDTSVSVGVFEQKEDIVKGTILTNTGDYRYLSGYVDEEKLILSTFNGAFAFRFEAEKQADGSLKGVFYSGTSFINYWNAEKNENVELTDPYSLVKAKNNMALDFSFPNLAGQMLSLKEDKFKNKVLVVQLLGSWCPNCLDETKFLAEFYKKNKHKNIEIIGLAFERKNNLEEAKPFLERLIKKFNVEYTILYAGKADKKEAVQKLPALENVLAFPTTIILDKKHQIRKIHTGFAGQGTGVYFEKFSQDFERFVEKLLAE